MPVRVGFWSYFFLLAGIAGIAATAVWMLRN